MSGCIEPDAAFGVTDAETAAMSGIERRQFYVNCYSDVAKSL
ncbi:hypothetical protein [Caulifigura coniformis]|nr:hypothetical protein [Caulifigura coniformis]